MEQGNSEQSSPKGYTTSACAMAASKAAAIAIVSGVEIHRVEVSLSEGVPLLFAVKTLEQSDQAASCLVIKNAGDERDMTHGAEIIARIAEEGEEGKKKIELVVQGGKGVGKVTQPGLPAAVGEWAIHPQVLSMIRDEVLQVLRHFGKKSRGKRFVVTIEVPKGEMLASEGGDAYPGMAGGISIFETGGMV